MFTVLFMSGTAGGGFSGEPRGPRGDAPLALTVAAAGMLLGVAPA